MRPIRLSMTAFGPYASTETIDFRNAIDGRLFGIYGATGAGKTSILDGICFALFGESSGDERQGADLRSHHATTDLETEVQLVFDLGPKRYNVVRRPTQTVAARRGGGVTTRQHFAALYDATGLDLTEITESTPGTVLAERKVETVAEKLTELLGYKAEQFRQVVLLPQGQFRKLLTAKSDERASVLRGLFDVSLYERFVDRLKSDAATLRSKVQETRLKIEGRLQSHAAADIMAVHLMLSSARAEADDLQLKREAADRLRGQARAELALGRQIETLFQEKDDAEVAWGFTEQRLAAIQLLKQRAEAAEAAKHIQPLEETLNEARKSLAESLKYESDCDIEAQKIAKAYEEARLALQASNERHEERTASNGEILRLEGFRERLDAAAPIRERLTRAKSELSSVKARLTEARRSVEAAIKQLQVAEESLGKAQTANEKLSGLRLHDAKLQTEEAAARNYEAQSRIVAQHLNRVVDAKRGADHTATALVEAKAAEVKAEAAMSAAQAVHLARKLVDGEPCPVCGSLEHPAPAHESPAGDGLDQTFRLARAAMQKAEVSDRDAAGKLAEAQGAHREASEAFARLPAPSRTEKEVSAERSGVSRELGELLSKSDVGNAKAMLDSAKTVKSDAELNLLTVDEKHKTAEYECVSAESALRTALADVPEELRDSGNLKAKLEEARERSQALANAHRTAVESERDSEGAVRSANAKLSTAQALTREKYTQSERAQAGFETALQDAGIAREAFAAALPDVPRLEAIKQELTSFDQTRASAQGRRDRALKAIEGQLRPDIQDLTAKVEGADSAVSELDGAVAAQSALVAALKSTVEAVTELQAEADVASAAFRFVGELSELSDGKNAQRIRLRDYAIAATFESVLDAANIRFSKMSQNRFTLLRKPEGADGRARSGLDIAVHDVHTEQFRDAHTLSGGEGFLASLSLALGLSDIVQHESGGVRLDTIFIDEGFGHLDDETLDLALTALRDLVGSDRAVGVISHVDAVKQQIPLGFDVRATLRGSTVEARM